jgi:hypothetical protein
MYHRTEKPDEFPLSRLGSLSQMNKRIGKAHAQSKHFFLKHRGNLKFYQSLSFLTAIRRKKSTKNERLLHNRKSKHFIVYVTISKKRDSAEMSRDEPAHLIIIQNTSE